MASLLRAYNAALIRRPVLTQCGTAAFLFCAGDVLAQQAIEKKGKNHDYQRTVRLTFYGGAIFGPIMARWYQYLGNMKFKNSTIAVGARVGLDQVILTPVAVGFFFSSMTFLEGKGIDEARKRIEAAYAPTLIRNWLVFLPTQILNFAIVPSHLRFVVVGVVSLFWNSYLSYANAKHVLVKSKVDKVRNVETTASS